MQQVPAMKKQLLLCFSLITAITGFSQTERNGLFLHAIGISSGYQDAFDSGNNPDGYYSIYYRMALHGEARNRYPDFPGMEWNRTSVTRVYAEFGIKSLRRSRFLAGISYQGYTHGRFTLYADSSVFLGYYGTPAGPAAYNAYEINQGQYVFDYEYRAVLCDIGYQFNFIQKKRFTFFAGTSITAGKTTGGMAYIRYQKTNGQLMLLTPGQELTYEPEPYYEYLESTYANNNESRNALLFRAAIPAGVVWNPFKKAEQLGLSVTGNAGASMLYKNGLQPVADLYYAAQIGLHWKLSKSVNPAESNTARL